MDPIEQGRRQAIRFAIDCNRATVVLLKSNRFKTPYILGAINALEESMKDWEDILSGAKVPTWPINA